jgi:hypothetical protein
MFSFDLTQRVNVPFLFGVQGVVQARRDSINDGRHYEVAYLTACYRNSRWYSEDEMLRANPSPEGAAGGVNAAGTGNKITVAIDVDDKKLKRTIARINRATETLRSKRKPAAIARKLRNRKR